MIRAVDLFAGFGGFTVGAVKAGARVVWAANHWPLAVETHALNHPDTEHVCQDLERFDFLQLPTYDLLLAGPSCQGHSDASQPQRKRLRAVRRKHALLRESAWAVVACAEVTMPRAMIIENVPRFLKWKLLPSWLDALQRLGYTIEVRKLWASRFGVPQRRQRVFILCTTRGRRVAPLVERPEVPFGPCIDWDAGDWQPLRTMAPKARARAEAARARLGRRFVGQHVTCNRGFSLDGPINTITTADQIYVVNGSRYRPITERETARGQGFSDSFRWPAHATRGEVIEGFGNAVPPPMAHTLISAVMEAM